MIRLLFFPFLVFFLGNDWKTVAPLSPSITSFQAMKVLVYHSALENFSLLF